MQAERTTARIKDAAFQTVRTYKADNVFDEIQNDARDHTFAHIRRDSAAQLFRKMMPWQQGHEARYEQMERARIWRYLSGDEQFDVDYYHTRMEARARANGESA